MRGAKPGAERGTTSQSSEPGRPELDHPDRFTSKAHWSAAEVELLSQALLRAELAEARAHALSELLEAAILNCGRMIDANVALARKEDAVRAPIVYWHGAHELAAIRMWLIGQLASTRRLPATTTAPDPASDG